MMAEHRTTLAAAAHASVLRTFTRSGRRAEGLLHQAAIGHCAAYHDLGSKMVCRCSMACMHSKHATTLVPRCSKAHLCKLPLLVAQWAGAASLQPPLNAVQVKDVTAHSPGNAEARVVCVTCAGWTKPLDQSCSVSLRQLTLFTWPVKAVLAELMCPMT